MSCVQAAVRGRAGPWSIRARAARAPSRSSSALRRSPPAHAGASTGRRVHRLRFKGPQHADVGLSSPCPVGGAVRRRRDTCAVTPSLPGYPARRAQALASLGVPMAAQGLIAECSTNSGYRRTRSGSTTRATLTRLAVLWAVAGAGLLVPHSARVPVLQPSTPAARRSRPSSRAPTPQ